MLYNFGAIKHFLTIKVDNVQYVPLKDFLTGRKVMDEAEDVSGCWVTVLWEVYFVPLFSRRWFQGFNWEGLRRRKLSSPLRREVKHRFNRFYNVFTYVTLCKKLKPVLLQLWFSPLFISAAQRTSGSQSFRHVSPWAWRTPDEFSGWDKDFWKRAVSKKKLFSQRRSDIKWWWTVSGGEVSVLPSVCFLKHCATDWLTCSDGHESGLKATVFKLKKTKWKVISVIFHYMWINKSLMP